MTKGLFFQAISKFLLGIILVGALLFIPAGTLHYWNGLLLISVLFIPMFFGGIILMIKNPELLKKRLCFKEKRQSQQKVVNFSAVMFIIGFVSAGISFRFNFAMLHRHVSLGACVAFLAAFLMYAFVLKENIYLSRTVEVQEGHKVIDTGLYKVVRHPMYSATLILFLAMPLILGSLLSFAVFLAYPFIIARRIKDEEELLKKELDGYCDYLKKVKYRLIPYVW